MKKPDYVGTDGRIYRGKAIKRRKNLEARQLGYQMMVKNSKGSMTGFKMPGSMSK